MYQIKRGNSSNLTRRVKDWIRKFGLIPDDFAILVTELKCTEPGCPPVETVVALLGPNGIKHQQKVHLAIDQISEVEASQISARLQQQLLGIESHVGEHDEHQ